MKTRPPLGSKVILSGDEDFAMIEIRDVDGALAYMDIVPVCAQDGLLYQIVDIKAPHGYGPLLFSYAAELVTIMGYRGLVPNRENVDFLLQPIWYIYSYPAETRTASNLSLQQLNNCRMVEYPDWLNVILTASSDKYLRRAKKMGVLNSQQLNPKYTRWGY